MEPLLFQKLPSEKRRGRQTNETQNFKVKKTWPSQPMRRTLLTPFCSIEKEYERAIQWERPTVKKSAWLLRLTKKKKERERLDFFFRWYYETSWNMLAKKPSIDRRALNEIVIGTPATQ